MPQVIEQVEERKQEFIAKVKALAKQVSQWSKEAGWEVKRVQVKVEDGRFGTYRAPELRVRISEREEVHLIPVGMDILGRWKGRVDLQVIPTLSSVSLLSIPDGWLIMTDSHVPIRLPWEAPTFVQLVHDMLS